MELIDPFNEPQLKQAVKGAWNGQRAPRELRIRMADLVEAPVSGSQSWLAVWFPGFSAIATAVIIIGMLVVFAPGRINSLPVATAQPFVKTHDRCADLNDHHFVPPQFADEMAATGRWLSSQAHVPVLAVNLDDGWDYCGAGPCPVGKFISGHLLFKRGKEDLSIFSVPASDVHLDSASREYEADVDGHGLAAFTRDGGFYCVVGRDRSGYADIDSVVRNVRQSLIKDFSTDTFSAAGPAPVRRPTLAVLLND